MEDSIRNFTAQFNFSPTIENAEKLGSYKKFVVGGMGGSHLEADMVKTLLPHLALKIHKDYGLPDETDWASTLFIASSFSGNTEETISFAQKAFDQHYPLAIITKGGKLLEFAKHNNLPFVKIPDSDIQPRIAGGFLILALASLLNEKELLSALHTLPGKLNVLLWEDKGKKLAEELRGKIPVIYSSEKNKTIAYQWKIKFNETGKIPAFLNVFPELNHNEMNGFDFNEKSAGLSEKFAVLNLIDRDDNSRIMKRIDITANLLGKKGLLVKKIEMEGTTKIIKIYNSLLLADWTALSIAALYGHEPDRVPMVEEFKKLMAQ